STPLPVNYTCNTFYKKSAAVASARHLDTIVIGDVNEDNRADVVGADPDDNLVWVHQGNGNGTFAPPTRYPANGSAKQVRLGDLNNDGHLDMVAGTDVPSLVSYLGRGDGTFAAGQSFSAPNATDAFWSLVVADFDNDGHLDAVGGGDYHLSYFRGVGDGTFQAAVDYSVSHSLYFGSAAIDIDLDGDLDLIYNLSDGTPAGPAFAVAKNNGNGTFGASVPYSCLSTWGTGLAAADFNGDGYPDIASVKQQENAVCLWFNQKDGTMGSPTIIGAPSGPFGIGAVDLNHDGAVDLLATGDRQGQQVALNDGHGNFPANMTSYPENSDSGTPSWALAVGDLTGDGNVDVVVGRHQERFFTVYL
ncbi:MAG: VCBS repeat-containing protein, partial [Oxalobacteraceae bacterium]